MPNTGNKKREVQEMKQYDIRLAKVPQPPKDCTGEPVMLTDATIQERLDKVLQGMKNRGLEQLVVYGDAEHCGNFQYLMGYFTRFEEALLVLDANGTAHFVLGNENLNKASKARIPGQAVHVSLFSLPNQPNRADKTLRALLEEAGIAPGRRIGITGWKHFTSPVENNEKLFDIPAFILDAIRAVTGGDENLFNAGVRPAINVGLSVSRVGGAAQIKAMKQVAGTMRLDLAQYRELAAFAQFGSDLDKATKAKLERGARLVELLKQPQYQPMPAQEQVASIYAATRGYMDDVPVDQIRRFESEMLAFMRDTRKDVLDAIKDKKVIDEAVEKALNEAITAFKQGYQA